MHDDLSKLTLKETLAKNLNLPSLSIDWHHFHQISDHNSEFELELLHLFAEDTDYHLKQLEAAIAAQDFSALEQHAHHIKGSSANLGLRSMQTAASILEIQARNHQLAKPASQILILQQTLKALQIFLTRRNPFGDRSVKLRLAKRKNVPCGLDNAINLA